jgi:hypothetical protein
MLNAQSVICCKVIDGIVVATQALYYPCMFRSRVHVNRRLSELFVEKTTTNL